MTWEYRIVRVDHLHGPVWGIHEVYYNEFGGLAARTENPITFIDEESPENIIDDLLRALETIRDTEVLTDDDFTGTLVEDEGE